MREDMEQLTFREELSRGTMVFDGGMGTYFSASEKLPGQGCEMANIEKPLLISAIHREYLEAGARAIKTNTFSSNRVAIPADIPVTDFLGRICCRKQVHRPSWMRWA